MSEKLHVLFQSSVIALRKEWEVSGSQIGLINKMVKGQVPLINVIAFANAEKKDSGTLQQFTLTAWNLHLSGVEHYACACNVFKIMLPPPPC